MIFRIVTEDVLIVSHYRMETNLSTTNDFKFNVLLSELATNKPLLSSLNLISMYSDKDDAVDFFVSYMNAFTNAKPEVTGNTLLQVMVTGRSNQFRLLETDFFKNLKHL